MNNQQIENTIGGNGTSIDFITDSSNNDTSDPNSDITQPNIGLTSDTAPEVAPDSDIEAALATSFEAASAPGLPGHPG